MKEPCTSCIKNVEYVFAFVKFIYFCSQFERIKLKFVILVEVKI